MLDQTAIPQVGVIDSRGREHADRSMDVLQYGTAFIAGLVALLLAVIH